MGRRANSTSRWASTAAAVVLSALALAAPAAAAPAAVDEYSLGPIGSAVTERDTGTRVPTAGEPTAAIDDSPGVVGETVPAESPLAVVGSLASPAAWALAAVIALAGAALLLPPRRTRPAR